MQTSLANRMTGKIGLNHTEVCTRQVRGLQIVKTFPYEVKPQTEKFLVSDEHSHIKYMYYLKKQSPVSSTFSTECLKTGLEFFCAGQVRGPQIADLSQGVKPQTTKVFQY